MEEDKLREIAQQEMKKAIMENLDSALIFTYIQKLEQENKELEYKLAVEKTDNIYHKEETCEETIPRYKILEKIKELEKTYAWALHCDKDYELTRSKYQIEVLNELLNG